METMTESSGTVETVEGIEAEMRMLREQRSTLIEEQGRADDADQPDRETLLRLVGADNLPIGCRIVGTSGSGTIVKVTDKSYLLDNGKRVSRTGYLGLLRTPRRETEYQQSWVTRRELGQKLSELEARHSELREAELERKREELRERKRERARLVLSEHAALRELVKRHQAEYDELYAAQVVSEEEIEEASDNSLFGPRSIFPQAGE